jgi:hypothetical protein
VFDTDRYHSLKNNKKILLYQPIIWRRKQRQTAETSCILYQAQKMENIQQDYGEMNQRILQRNQK